MTRLALGRDDTNAVFDASGAGTPAVAPAGGKSAGAGMVMRGLIALMVVLMVAVVAGFSLVFKLDAELDAAFVQDQAVAVAARDLAEIDASITRMIAPPGSSFSRYDFDTRIANAKARYVASVQGAADINLQRVTRLVEGWLSVGEALDMARYDQARTRYADLRLDKALDAVERESDAVRNVISDIYARDAVGIDLAIWLTLVGVLAGSLVALIGLSYVNRRSQFEARERQKANAERDRALAHANDTRFKVTRLFEMTDILQSATDLADANAVLMATARELLPGIGGALYVFNNSRDRLTLATYWDVEDASALTDSFGVNQCWALKRGKVHVNNQDTTRLCCGHHHAAHPVMEIPMMARGEILGLLHLTHTAADAERRLIDAEGIGSALADAMSLALSNLALRDKLRGQALRDPLTGLYNRRYMEDTLERVVKLAERDNHEVAVIMIDLDHFKRLNDQFGHAKGDSVLRDSASIIISQLRETDIACRFGGEELMVIMPNCPVEQAAARAESIRRAIEGLSEPNGPKVSASFGVSSIFSTATSLKELMSSADAALYQAKANGRNQVACAPPVEGPAIANPAGKRRRRDPAAGALVAGVKVAREEEFDLHLVAAE